jgi:AmiR/NasT family two-component response regulator
MTQAPNSNQLWPADFTEEAIVWQAVGILMRRYDLEAADALEMLRKMANSASKRMSMIAEQIVNRSGGKRA